jgi:hypothetical protein
MRDHVKVTVKKVNGGLWGDLAVMCDAHDFIGESVKEIEANFSFAGGHRVRRYRFKKSVHWLIPQNVKLDISDVASPTAPRRR